MSLHLGNLSPRICKDELERIFRQFGRCSVLLKDGYGFAIYDFEGDAEVALRTLKGRKICGQTLDLSWSDKQPKPLQRFPRAGKPHDMIQRGRNPERNDYSAGHNFSESHGRRQKFTGLHEDKVGFNCNVRDHNNYNQNKEFTREGDRIQPNQVGTERWGEGVHNLRNGNGKVVDKQMGFDRYQPDYGDERFVEYDGNHDLGQFPDSPSARMLSDKYRRIHHPDNTRGSQTCFKCGAAGHKVRDCPFEGALHERKSNHSDNKHEKEPEIGAQNEVGGPECRSRDRLGSSNRYPKSAIQYDGTTRCSQVENESNRTKEKYNSGKKRREREDPAEGPNDTKVRRLGSSHPHSDHTSPKLSTHSRSQEPLSMAGSQSVSRSPLPHSLSVSSRSKANSHNSRSRSMKSKSRSTSRSRSSSLSVSVGRSARSPSLNEERVNLNSPLNGSPIPHSKEILTEINKLFEPDDGENSPMENGTETLSENQQPELDLVDYDPISPDCPDTNLNEPLEDDDIPHSKEVILEKNGDNDATAADLSVEKRNVSEKVPMEDGTEALTENQQQSPEVMLEKNRGAAELSVEKQKVAEELKNEGERTISMEPVNISDPNAPSSSGTGGRLRISADEVKRVLKHYRLKRPDNNDHTDTVEDYFGCARMWPWEMIYYRRHKKGLVSAENHAIRVTQNTTFGIVDKFIRSSSGWFEPIEALP